MQGSIQKRTGKRGPSYRVRVDLPVDPVTGERRQRSATFRTEREAEAALAAWVNEIGRGTAASRPCSRWLTSCVGRSVTWRGIVSGRRRRPATAW